jgi:hypothetical protein
MAQHSEGLEIVPRRLQPGQIGDAWIANVGADRPNWCTPPRPCSSRHPTVQRPRASGQTATGCSGGLIWGPEAELERVLIDDLPPINNDRVLDAERAA